MVSDVERVREFNRSWTELLGLLDRGLLGPEHTLTEARVVFELGRARRGMERLQLRNRLGMDQSFLGRVLTDLQRRGLVEVTRSETDGRRRSLALTASGRAAYRTLNRRSSDQIRALLAPLSDDQRRTLVESMSVVQSITRPGRDDPAEVALRGLGPGDLGWVVARHGALYADEYGWDADFEALVARITADFHDQARPNRDAAWIATVDGARAGCVLCVERDATTAQLRLLLVEPWARGLGLGSRLVDECITFARAAGYQSMVLWTNDVLASARRIYEAAGFELTDEEPHRSFGHDLVGQTWTLSSLQP